MKKLENSKLEALKGAFEEFRGFGSLELFQAENSGENLELSQELFGELFGLFRLEQGCQLFEVTEKQARDIFMAAGSEGMAYSEQVDKASINSFMEEYFELAGGCRAETRYFTNRILKDDTPILMTASTIFGLATFEAGILTVNQSMLTLGVICDED